MFLIGYIVGSLFINIFATTYDTLLTCYLMQQNLREFHQTDLKFNDQAIAEVINNLGGRNGEKYIPLEDN